MLTSSSTERRGRRSQRERREKTRGALLDAAASSLIERGYAGTTVPEVAHRAGVSLGALVHYFPAKTDLLVAALDHVLDRRLAEFDQALEELGPGEARLPQIVDTTWRLFQSPAFLAWLELWVAARCEPELLAAVTEVDARFTHGVAERWARALPDEAATASAEVIRSLLFAVCNGMALRRVVPVGHEAEADEVLALLKARFCESEENGG